MRCLTGRSQLPAYHCIVNDDEADETIGRSNGKAEDQGHRKQNYRW